MVVYPYSLTSFFRFDMSHAQNRFKINKKLYVKIRCLEEVNKWVNSFISSHMAIVVGGKNIAKKLGYFRNMFIYLFIF